MGESLISLLNCLVIASTGTSVRTVINICIVLKVKYGKGGKQYGVTRAKTTSNQGDLVFVLMHQRFHPGKAQRSYTNRFSIFIPHLSG